MPGKRDRIARSVFRTSLALGFVSFFPAFFGLLAFEIWAGILKIHLFELDPHLGLAEWVGWLLLPCGSLGASVLVSWLFFAYAKRFIPKR